MAMSALRPGIRLGIYPERREQAPDPLERIGSAWLARLTQVCSWRKYQLDRVVTRVKEEAEGLDSLNEDALRQRLESIRYILLRDGLTEPAILRCFALIREYARRSLLMRYRDVQLFGAWVIVNGNMAEMATGEGKSFTATLAAGTAALAGIPVHIVTTNEYLAQRDADELRPLFAALGLSVSAVLETMDTDAKRAAYRCDVVYCTNKQVAFDYLRDRLVSRNESGRLTLKFGQEQRGRQLVLRGLCFAIVDEADSILVDEARTPLILSREHEDESRQQICQQALDLAQRMQASIDYRVDKRQQKIELTPAGRAWLEQQTQSMTGVWAGQRHTRFLVHQGLCALHLFKRNVHYLVRDGSIEIIDRNTGRTMADRSWQQGLHQMIECKENCTATGQRETLASISYQRFFRRYLHLGGMSGTLRQVAGEMRSVYQQGVISVPTHRPSRWHDLGITVHRRAQDKWLAVMRQIESVHASGQPVLVGTGSVHDSDLLGSILTRRGLTHRVLNARQDQEEALIVSLAGQPGQITIATNMAGRGTDITLGPGVAEKGGLYVIATECHEEYRVDRQLHGRCARQGEPGSSETRVSLQDSLIRNFYPRMLLHWLETRWNEERPLPPRLTTCLVRLPQYVVSRRHRLERIDVMQMNEKLGKMLAYSGRRE